MCCRKALAKRFERRFSGDERQIKTLKQPTLILWSAKDELIPVDNVKRFQNDIVGPQRVVYDELSPIPHEEDPQKTVAAVREFLVLP